MSNRGPHPVDWLRGLALSLERLAAQGVASGAVRGAADELRAGLPGDLDAQVRMLVEHGLTLLDRLVRDAARARVSPIGTWSRTAAQGAVRGAVEEFRRLVPEMRPATKELLARLKLWLDRSASEAAARAQEIRAPGDRARIAAAGAIEGATEQLNVALPRLTAPAGELAASLGRSLVRGTAEEVGRQFQLASRSPVFKAVAAGTAIVALLFVLKRR